MEAERVVRRRRSEIEAEQMAELEANRGVELAAEQEEQERARADADEEKAASTFLSRVLHACAPRIV